MPESFDIKSWLRGLLEQHPQDETGTGLGGPTRAEVMGESIQNMPFGLGDDIRGLPAELGNQFRAVMQGFTGNKEMFPTDKYVPDDAFGGTKTNQAPLPAPPQSKEDQRRFAQDSSQKDRNEIQGNYLNDANTRSQVARQVTRDHEISRAPAWAQKFINAGKSSGKGGLQEY